MFLCIQQIHIVILRVQVGFLVRKYLQVLKRHRKLMSEKLHGKSLIQHICIKLLHQEVKCSIQNAAVSIATALDVSTDYLFNLTNEPKRKTNTSVDIFPQKLKQVMIKRNMKEKELALQTGISVSTIYQ